MVEVPFALLQHCSSYTEDMGLLMVFLKVRFWVKNRARQLKNLRRRAVP